MLNKRIFSAALLSMLTSITAFAAQPQPWQMGLQPAATPIMEKITSLHNFVLVIITGIALFVGVVLGFVLWRFRASKNPTPSKRAHNPLLEAIWITIPVLILVVIAFPSFNLMFYSDRVPEPGVTIKATGNMWYWQYSYPEHDINFDSNMIVDKDLKANELRLYEVDNQVVIPVNTNVRLLFTAADVIHSWTIPAFGIKKDCVPGRLNEAWINVKQQGIYYGQCSELCGMNHGFMPIAVRAVSKEEFNKWVKENKGSNNG